MRDESCPDPLPIPFGRPEPEAPRRRSRTRRALAVVAVTAAMAVAVTGGIALAAGEDGAGTTGGEPPCCQPAADGPVGDVAPRYSGTPIESQDGE